MRRNRDFIGPAGMGGLVSLWGQSSLIESIQYGTVSWTTNAASSGTATITAVDTARAFVVFIGQSCANTTANAPNSGFARVALTNSTTVTATAGGTSGSADAMVVSFAVVQVATGVLKSIQAGTISVASATSGTATITEVNSAKAYVIYGGMSTADTTASAFGPNTTFHRVTLTNSTTVTANRVTAGSFTATVAFTALESF